MAWNDAVRRAGLRSKRGTQNGDSPTAARERFDHFMHYRPAGQSAIRQASSGPPPEPLQGAQR